MKVTTGTTPAQLARELHSRSGFSARIRLGKPDRYPWLGGDLKRFAGYRACVRRAGGHGAVYRPRVYISRFRYRLAPGQWPFYQKHLADSFGMADSSQPYPANPGGVDVPVTPYYTHFVEFYIDRPPVLRVLEADMQKGPAFESFEVRDAFIDAGIFVNCLPMPYEWDSYHQACAAPLNGAPGAGLAGLQIWYSNPDQFAYPPGCGPELDLVDPESEAVPVRPRSRLGWREPASPCACRACAAHGHLSSGP